MINYSQSFSPCERTLYDFNKLINFPVVKLWLYLPGLYMNVKVS